jgi:beta-glucuronidase
LKTIRSFVGALGIAITPGVVAQFSGTTVLEDVDHRTATSLDGEWHTIVDPYFAGYYNFHHEVRTDGFYRNAPLKPDSTQSVEYDFSRAPLLRVPGDWDTRRSDLFLYEGPVWYQREGLISDQGKHKQAFYVLQKAYKDKSIGSATAKP